MPMHADMPACQCRKTNGGMDMSSPMAMTGSYGFYAMTREASGTSWQPEAAPHERHHADADDWMVMLHGRALGIADSQSGPRGGSDTFAAGMVMAMATRALTATTRWACTR